MYCLRGSTVFRFSFVVLVHRVCIRHVNVTANHITLAHKPSLVAPTLPLGKGFSITIAGVVADERTQVWTCAELLQ